MKTLFKLLAVFSLLLNVNAASSSTAIAAAGTNNILAGPVQAYQLMFANASGSAVTVKLLDAPSTAQTYTAGAYTLISRTGPTNVVTTFTNFFGVVQTYTNYAITTVTNSVGASTNSFPVIGTFVIPANSTTFYTPESTLKINNGLLVTNQAAITVTVDYIANRP